MKTVFDIASATALGFLFIAILYGDRATVLLRPFMPSPAFIKLQGVQGSVKQKRLTPRTGSSNIDTRPPLYDMKKSLSWLQIGHFPPAMIHKKKDCERLKTDLHLPITQVFLFIRFKIAIIYLFK